MSTSSLSSAGSCRLPSRVLARRTDSACTPPQSPSSFSLNIGRTRARIDRHSDTTAISRGSSLTSAFSGSGRLASASSPEHRESKLLDVIEGEDETVQHNLELATPVEKALPEHKPEQKVETVDDLPDDDELESPTSGTTKSADQEPMFHTYLNHLAKNRHSPPQPIERWLPEDFEHKPLSSPGRQARRGHNKSDSQGSSLAFVTAVKSATVTLASASIASVSRRATRWRRGQQRSSLISESDHRRSVDSQRSVSDEGAKERGRKRRAKLEELIRTEESYVADLKALSNAYFTILGHQPTTTSFARGSAQKTIAEILHLHDDILGSLHRAMPFAEYDQRSSRVPPAVRSHNRWHSIDVVPTRTRSILATIRQGRRSLDISRSTDEEPAVIRSSPQAVSAVARVFAYNMARFSVYEDYGANYDLVLQDVDETQRSITGWADFDKAIEAISAYVNPTRSREANRKRATTLKDLLIKPIQRIPRYELFFSDLSTLTPVCDDPSVHTELGDLRAIINHQALRMNEAKDNPTRAKTLETTWLIGDRLTFSTSQLPKSVFLQLLGPVSLCGCLHIAYRSHARIKGYYVIAILFGTSVLLASSDEDSMRYSVLAGIALANATIEEVDNNKGLQCHSAPHSWKIVFEQSAKMYELLFTACTAVEAHAWRAHIARGIETQSQAVAEGKANVLPLSSPLTSDMKNVGKAFGKPSSFVRRMPERAATVGTMNDLSQVIIKNTQAAKEAQEYNSRSSLQIPRSQSMSTHCPVPILSPPRCERHRLETLLSDVWTRNQLPYPGMARRTDPLRASANNVIRKFSMASITSNFSSSKRNGSYTSISSWRREDVPPAPRSRASGRDTTNSSVSSRRSKPALVNFHTTPDAFLPTDFEIPATSKKRSALRTFTMTIERPFTPLMGNENVQSGVRRAESVRDAVVDAFSRPSWSPAPPPVRHEVQPPVYSVVQERAKTPGTLHVKGGSDETVVGVSSSKGPRKSKSRLLGRLFG